MIPQILIRLSRQVRIRDSLSRKATELENEKDGRYRPSSIKSERELTQIPLRVLV